MIDRLRRAAIALLAGVFALAPWTAQPAHAAESGIWSGTCPIVNFSISQPGRAVPKPGAFSMSASGTCTGTTPSSVIKSGSGGFTLPTVTSNSFGCVNGTAAGQGTAWGPGLPGLNVSITVVNSGGLITVTLVQGIRYVAVAEFAATSIAACNNNGVLSGVGTLTYFDPTLPPPLS